MAIRFRVASVFAVRRLEDDGDGEEYETRKAWKREKEKRLRLLATEKKGK